jgi:hypothetical protein
VIDSISPTSGPLPDVLLTATGQNFTDNSKLVIDGIQQNTARNGNQLTASFTGQEAGTINVFVHDDTGDSNTKQFTFTATRTRAAPRPPAGE